MKPFLPRAADLAAPKQQRNWDWRAAANFICGGAGGGLLLFASMAGFDPGVTRTAILLGLALIGTGLTCVWFEIGRPWRALNVYRHFATSWMTREAVVALVLFPCAVLTLATGQSQLLTLSGLLGMAFLYSQARILSANKGIPAWRHPRSVPLMVVTGLAEGAGFLACVVSLSAAPIGSWILFCLLTLIPVRAWGWHMYLAGLAADGAPSATLQVLSRLTSRFVMLGNVLPAVAVVAVMAGMPGQRALLFAGGIFVVASGWFLKYSLVRRAAFTQGLALGRLPVRGSGAGGAAVKPGWRPAAGPKAG